MRELSELMAVLHMERQIEAAGVATLRDLARRGALAKHLLDRIAGNDVNEQKDRRQNRPKSRQREQEECRRWRAIRPRIRAPFPGI